MVIALLCDIVESGFKLQSRYCVHIQANALVKDMNPSISPVPLNILRSTYHKKLDIPKNSSLQFSNRENVHTISFQPFFVQAFKIVVDSWKFCMFLLYILWDDWPMFMISRSNEQLQQQLECIWRRFLRRGLQFHVCTINKSVDTKKVWKLIVCTSYILFSLPLRIRWFQEALNWVTSSLALEARQKLNAEEIKNFLWWHRLNHDSCSSSLTVK